MRAAGAIAVLSVALAACSPGHSSGNASGLSDKDIRAALADKLDQPSCVTSIFYHAFPIEPSSSMAGNHHPDFDALVTAGLATKTGKTYALTPAGQAAYHPDRQGFCYSAGYDIVKVLDIAPIPDDQLAGGVADKAWRVTLSIAQKPLAEWVRNPVIAKRAISQDVFSTEPKTYRVTLAHLRGEEGIKRKDLMFMLPSGFSY